MPAPRAATEHHRTQQQLAAKATVAARHIWSRMNPADFDGSWRRLGPQLRSTLTVAQARAAVDSVNYVPRVLAEQGIRDKPAGQVAAVRFAGVASSGGSLADLLYIPVIRAKQAVADRGVSGADALLVGRSLLDGIILTQVADAGRTAAGTALVARPAVSGYVREIGGQGCDRCIELAGGFYRWNDGFDRHPQCGCVHVPTDADRSDELLSDAPTGGAAITARSGLSTAAVGKTRGSGQVMPEQIYQSTRSRDDAIRLLHHHGYLT